MHIHHVTGVIPLVPFTPVQKIISTFPYEFCQYCYLAVLQSIVPLIIAYLAE